jgi:hypothetical protein
MGLEAIALTRLPKGSDGVDPSIGTNARVLGGLVQAWRSNPPRPPHASHAAPAIPRARGACWREAEIRGHLIYRRGPFRLSTGFPAAVAVPLQALARACGGF